MKLIIDRSKWYRGFNSESALVRTQDGLMCCLGFLGILFGGDPYSKKTEAENGILGSIMPNKNQKIWPPWLFDSYPEKSNNHEKIQVCQQLAIINDEPELINRENKISNIMKEYGDIDVEFVGE